MVVNGLMLIKKLRIIDGGGVNNFIYTLTACLREFNIGRMEVNHALSSESNSCTKILAAPRSKIPLAATVLCKRTSVGKFSMRDMVASIWFHSVGKVKFDDIWLFLILPECMKICGKPRTMVH